jgi:four helix bundle protein
LPNLHINSTTRYSNKVYKGQIIRSSSSGAASYCASQRAKSRPDFINKRKIDEEELDETLFFREMLEEFNQQFSEDLKALLSEGETLLKIIVASIVSLTLGRLLNDTSAASLMNLDKSEISGFLLGKLDPFMIWAYSVVSIGLAKMFKSSSAGKYFVLVFGIWIIGSFLIWLLGKAVPFLSFLSEM